MVVSWYLIHGLLLILTPFNFRGDDVLVKNRVDL